MDVWGLVTHTRGVLSCPLLVSTEMLLPVTKWEKQTKKQTNNQSSCCRHDNHLTLTAGQQWHTLTRGVLQQSGVTCLGHWWFTINFWCTSVQMVNPKAPLSYLYCTSWVLTTVWEYCRLGLTSGPYWRLADFTLSKNLVLFFKLSQCSLAGSMSDEWIEGSVCPQEWFYCVKRNS